MSGLQEDGNKYLKIAISFTHGKNSLSLNLGLHINSWDITFNDMPQAIECDLLLYADDSVLFFSHKNVDVINDQLNRDNKLSIHFGEDKTRSILFTSKNKIKKWATCQLIMETSKLSNIPR